MDCRASAAFFVALVVALGLGSALVLPGFRRYAQTEDLISACVAGDARVVARLLAMGADPNTYDNGVVLAKTSSTDVARLLLDYGADPDGRPDLHSVPLASAASVEMARLLLSHGADPNCADEDGWTPLMHAVSSLQTDLVGALLAAGADPAHMAPGGESVDSVSRRRARLATDSERRAAAEIRAALRSAAVSSRHPATQGR